MMMDGGGDLKELEAFVYCHQTAKGSSQLLIDSLSSQKLWCCGRQIQGDTWKYHD